MGIYLFTQSGESSRVLKVTDYESIGLRFGSKPHYYTDISISIFFNYSCVER